VALTAALGVAAALSALGAVAVGCIVLYWWLAVQHGPNVALAVLGGGFALLASVLFALMSRGTAQSHPTAPCCGSRSPRFDSRSSGLSILVIMPVATRV
jgi:hypothetical protein